MMTQLSVLTLSNNRELTGTLPSTITTTTTTTTTPAPALSYLDLSNTAISGTIPTELGLFTKLSRLLLEETMMAGMVSGTVLEHLQHLKQFSIRGCFFTGSIPSELETLSHLEQLDISDNVRLCF